MTGEYRAWLNIVFYNSNKQRLSTPFEDYVGPNPSVGEYMFEREVPANASYLRFSVNYYDHPTVDVKVTIEKGSTQNIGHYLAPEDMLR